MLDAVLKLDSQIRVVVPQELNVILEEVDMLPHLLGLLLVRVDPFLVLLLVSLAPLLQVPQLEMQLLYLYLHLSIHLVLLLEGTVVRGDLLRQINSLVLLMELLDQGLELPLQLVIPDSSLQFLPIGDLDPSLRGFFKHFSQIFHRVFETLRNFLES